MKIGFIFFGVFLTLVGLLIFRFETPRRNRNKTGMAGRGGDFES